MVSKLFNGSKFWSVSFLLLVQIKYCGLCIFKMPVLPTEESELNTQHLFHYIIYFIYVFIKEDRGNLISTPREILYGSGKKKN